MVVGNYSNKNKKSILYKNIFIPFAVDSTGVVIVVVFVIVPIKIKHIH
jgi:hypothetical protein